MFLGKLLKVHNVMTIPKLSMDTQTSIESCGGAFKHWFSLETKGL
jgi:hypothetical protein